MKEIVITSSILIAVVLLLRLLFRGKVSQRLLYCAWLLVAARLLIPFQFGEFALSVHNLTEAVESRSETVQQAQALLQQPAVANLVSPDANTQDITRLQALHTQMRQQQLDFIHELQMKYSNSLP